MNVEEARRLTELSETALSDEVVSIIYFIEEEISHTAKVGNNSIDCTQYIPPYGCTTRTAWLRAIEEMKKKGFKTGSTYLGKAYAINGNHYSEYITW